MAIKIGRDVTLSSVKITQVFTITWFFIVLGSALSLIFILMAESFNKSGFFYFFLQNFGIFIFFISLLAGFSGVYRVVNSTSSEIKIRDSIRDSLKRSRYIIAVSFMTVILFSSVVLIETGISMVSEIPFAGPAIIALFTAPFFILNIFIVVTAVCVLAVVSPVTGEVDGVKNIVSEISGLIKREWLNIVLYLLLTFSILVLGVILMVLVIRYAGGITKAVQWKIFLAYPPSMKNLVSVSYFSEVIGRIVPASNPMEALQQYGNDLPGYLKIIKYIITVSFMLVFSLLATFPFAIYFSFSSVCFKKIWKAV